VFILPGVPSEMREMYRRHVAPAIEALLREREAKARSVILTRKVNTFGMGESALGQRLGSLMARDRNPKVGTTVSDGVVGVRIRSEFNDADLARHEMDATTEQVERTLGPIVFGRDDATLEAGVVGLLRERGLRLAVAESCTGGLLGGMLTDVPGSSEAFVGGWITYADELKTRELGVGAQLIASHGAVSEPVAIAMAQGAAVRSGANLALAITGIAGPGGGTPEKPVGTVWIALARRAQSGDVAAKAVRLLLGEGRRLVRDRAARCALQLLRFDLLGVPWEEMRWGRPGVG
jgi:nicotinamide-nucleotide amidase